MRWIAGCLPALLALLGFAAASQAGTVHGTVNNGTTGKPGAGVEVILIQLQGGMQPIANTKTDGAGQLASTIEHWCTADVGARRVQGCEFSSAAATRKRFRQCGGV